jgi:hypothetical protein
MRVLALRKRQYSWSHFAHTKYTPKDACNKDTKGYVIPEFSCCRYSGSTLKVRCSAPLFLTLKKETKTIYLWTRTLLFPVFNDGGLCDSNMVLNITLILQPRGSKQHWQAVPCVVTTRVVNKQTSKNKTNKLRGLSLRANYIDRAIAACRRT